MTPVLRILYLEPFEGGSHAAFSRALTQGVTADWTTLTLPGRHWKWRMRGAAPLWALSEAETLAAEYDLVFASSYVPLAELYGLAPSLGRTPSVLYFHENQFTYPTQAEFHRERDHQYGVTQLISGLAATGLVFNSEYNRQGFLRAGRGLLAKLPDHVPPGWIDDLEAKSEVLGLPLDLPTLDASVFAPSAPVDRAPGPLILWNHRWAHDKAPEDFAQAILQLFDEGLPFRVALCGRRHHRVPEGFEALRDRLGPRLLTFGEAGERDVYEGWLRRADVAVSAARHEFFGVAMLEAAHFGADLLVPDDLAYPELFGPEHRYPRGKLAVALRERIARWQSGEALRADRRALTARFGAPMLERYRALLERVAATPRGPAV